MCEYELLCSSKSHVRHRRCLRSCREAHRGRRRSNDNELKSIPPTTPFPRYAIHSNTEAPCMRKALEIISKGEMRKRVSDRGEEDIRINRLYWLIDLKLKINVHDADEMRSDGTSKWIEESLQFSEKRMCSATDKRGFTKGRWHGRRIRRRTSHTMRTAFYDWQIGSFSYFFILLRFSALHPFIADYVFSAVDNIHKPISIFNNLPIVLRTASPQPTHKRQPSIPIIKELFRQFHSWVLPDFFFSVEEKRTPKINKQT